MTNKIEEFVLTKKITDKLYEFEILTLDFEVWTLDFGYWTFEF